MRLKFLVLTDHSGHSAQNSLYALVTTLARDVRCAGVDVASRGLNANKGFFTGAGTQVRGVAIYAGDRLEFRADGGRLATAGKLLDPSAYDVVWLRLPHPVAHSFFDYLAGLRGALVVNDPVGIRRTGDKSWLLNFPQLTPPSRLVHSAEEVRAFARQHPLVLKPLRAYGGKGIVRVDGPEEVPDIIEPYLAMKFLENVGQGDKRILLVNGRVMGASLRLPPPGEWRCNVALGGRSVAAELMEEERTIVSTIAPVLRRNGICFAGIDTLVADDGRRVLSEINTLSIGGFPQAEAQSGRPVLQQTIDELFSYCYDRLGIHA